MEKHQVVAMLQKAPVAVSLSDAVQFSAASRQQLTAGQPQTSDQDYLYVCEVDIGAAVSLLIVYIYRQCCIISSDLCFLYVKT